MLDDDEFEYFKKEKLFACKDVQGNIRVFDMFSYQISRVIMDSFNNDKVVDHIDGNTLNNQRSNLRTCTQGENMRNQKISSRNTSGIKGVSWSKNRERWLACIKGNGKQIYLGHFICPLMAKLAYNKAAVKYHGEFANFG